jgi:eukaryotic-like serine/threonine-protein kinase
MLIAAGTLLEGKYRVERLLGAGGMGSVWIAEHMMLNRPVAVKILDTSATTRDATAVQRFLREAQTAARLRSDHIVDVLDVGKFDDGTPFLIMELLEGETLSSRIKTRGRLAQNEAAMLVDQLLSGLSAAHDAGVIHRDIKPDNCFITQKLGRDHLKLLDFGISKVAGDAREMRMTRTGVVMGTPYYMAPEQARGSKEIDHRCDLYAVGAILYECVTGRVPFEAESVNELLFKIVLEPLIPPRSMAPELEPSFEEVILHAMGREADQRYQNAAEFREALAPYIGRINSGTQVVVLSSPPPATPRMAPPISGNEATAPIDSDAVKAIARESGPGRHTPSGLQGLSKTGPLHLSDPPPTRSSGAIIAIAAVALLGVGGGAMYLSSSRAPAAASALPPTPTESATEKVDKPVIEKAAMVPVPTASESTAPPPVTTTAKPALTATKGNGKKVAPPTTATNTAIVVPPPPPPPPPTATNTGKSPRPIDTAL